jgi:hypothetical protein
MAIAFSSSAVAGIVEASESGRGQTAKLKKLKHRSRWYYYIYFKMVKNYLAVSI